MNNLLLGLILWIQPMADKHPFWWLLLVDNPLMKLYCGFHITKKNNPAQSQFTVGSTFITSMGIICFQRKPHLRFPTVSSATASAAACMAA
jgi:hypothetical protein